MKDEKLDPITRRKISRLGGLARAKKLSKERRTEIAIAGANARWGEDDLKHVLKAVQEDLILPAKK